MEIGTVGVVGLGTMGAGIAEVCARHGHRVIAIEPEDDSLERGRGSIDGSTQRAVKRGKLTEEERAEILGRITFSTNLEELAGADLVVEAIPEDLD
ncbi:MAG: 3-hydroxyacyl-CoA dehydrogenase family protein, partial [Candidatus Nanopelagicales bacterium]